MLGSGVCYGQLDVEAEDPQPTAERLRRLLPADTQVIASPLQRTRCLAKALHPQPLFDARLLEINFGEWEGVGWDDIDRRMLDAWAADVLHFAAPGGESAAVLQARARACVESLHASSVALVTHAGVIRSLLGHWLDLPLGEWSRLPVDFGSISLLEIATTGRQARREEKGRATAPAILHYLNC